MNPSDACCVLLTLRRMAGILKDGQWAAFEPLIEACRPPAKVAPQNLRQTMSAILWRHQNGAKWRAVPEALELWWKAVQTFIRWSRLGVWEQLLTLVQKDRVELGMTFLMEPTSAPIRSPQALLERRHPDATR